MPNPSYALIMLAAGIGIPVLAALNASLGRQIGAPAAASVVLFAVALLTCLAVVMVTGPQAIAKVAAAPKHLLLADCLKPLAFNLIHTQPRKSSSSILAV